MAMQASSQAPSGANRNAAVEAGVATAAPSLLDSLAAAPTPEAVQRTLAAIGLPYLFWQMYEPETVQTWHRFPSGFFAHYYGVDADRDCAVANAVRAHWGLFPFDEARRRLGGCGAAKAAERVWEAFGIRDGAVAPGGRAGVRTISVFGVDRAGGGRALIERNAGLLALAAARLDDLLMKRRAALIPIPRAPIDLSDAMKAALRVTIEHPAQALSDQAALLGISPRTLERRHRQIARRFGVSTYAGAIAVAAREPRRYLDA